MSSTLTDASNNSTIATPIMERTEGVVGSILPERKLRRVAATRELPGLVLHVFQIENDGKVVPIEDSYAGLNEALAWNHTSESTYSTTSSAPSSKKDQVDNMPSYWVNIDADERDRVELNEWIEELNLGGFITDQITKPAEGTRKMSSGVSAFLDVSMGFFSLVSFLEWISHVVSTRSKALIMIRILPVILEDGSFGSHQVEFLAAVTTKEMLLTYTTQNGSRRSLNKASIDYMTQDECLQGGSSSAALIAWLEFHVFRTQQALTQIRKNSVTLVKRLDKDPSSVQLEEILQLRDKLLIVLAVAEEQSQCLAMVKAMDKDTEGVNFKGLKGALSILVATAESTERMGLRLEKRAAGLKAAFDSHQQNRMNRRLALLTVLSAVFMPLTFMAGIYGMNFVNIPEYGMFGLQVKICPSRHLLTFLSPSFTADLRTRMDISIS